MQYLTPKQAVKAYGVHIDTLRRWADEGSINFTRTNKGHRRYEPPTAELKADEARCIVYARVSSDKQRGDLERQIEFLHRKYPSYQIVKDIGSGLNFKRQGFKYILEQLLERNIKEVVVASADRFSRFGTRDFFDWLFIKHDAKLTVYNKPPKDSPDELTNELLEVITVYTARHHGRRRYNNNKKNTNISNPSTEESLQEVLPPP